MGDGGQKLGCSRLLQGLYFFFFLATALASEPTTNASDIGRAPLQYLRFPLALPLRGGRSPGHGHPAGGLLPHDDALEQAAAGLAVVELHLRALGRHRRVPVGREKFFFISCKDFPIL